MEIVWKLEPEDIEHEMDWTSVKTNPANKDRENIQKKPDKETIITEENVLAHLLMNDVIFLNDHWWEDTWPEAAKKITSLNVNCNDVFAWGCADAEELPHAELENLYRMWRKDPEWGAAVWCMQRRKQMPQKPVEDLMRKAGIWDLDNLGLGQNTMDKEVTQYIAETFGQKR